VPVYPGRPGKKWALNRCILKLFILQHFKRLFIFPQCYTSMADAMSVKAHMLACSQMTPCCYEILLSDGPYGDAMLP